MLDVTPDEEMVNEGVIRDILNRIQRLRKDFKIVPTDNIDVYYQVTPDESKLGALIRKSAENIEANIKKPFKSYEKTLSLQVAPKSFDVIFCFVLKTNQIYKIKSNFLIIYLSLWMENSSCGSKRKLLLKRNK